MLVDSHCHLDFPDFAAERDAVVARARAAGVGAMITICTHVSRFDAILEVADSYPDVVCSLGIHPHHAEPEAGFDDPAQLTALVRRHPRIVGIGETGLDYYYDSSPRPRQAESFRNHIRVCRDTGLPLIIHTRDAEEDTVRILREEGAGPGSGLKGVFHCFSGSAWLAQQALELGFHISLSGIVTFKKAEALRAAVAEVPLERLLVETDAPYLAPVPYRGKRNEPAYVVHTAKAVAALKGVDVRSVEASTTAAFHAVFDRAAAQLEQVDPAPCA